MIWRLWGCKKVSLLLRREQLGCRRRLELDGDAMWCEGRKASPGVERKHYSLDKRKRRPSIVNEDEHVDIDEPWFQSCVHISRTSSLTTTLVRQARCDSHRRLLSLGQRTTSCRKVQHLRHQMSNILHALSSTFTTCACGARAQDCTINRMAAFVDGVSTGNGQQEQHVDLGPLVAEKRFQDQRANTV
jgi:hypothetical protein